MDKDTFTVIVVPHDPQKTRNYEISYRLFHVLVAFVCIGLVAMVVFVATYGKLLLKARESLVLAGQVEDLTRRNERIGEVVRNLSELHAMDLKVRQMLGVDIAGEDSLAIYRSQESDGLTDREVQSGKEQMLRSIPCFWPVRGYITKSYNVSGGAGDPDHHPGIDIGVERGTPVRSAASGYIVEAGWDDAYGYYVLMDHGYGIKTLYGHNDRLVVMRGERVGRGQTIAYSGNTGRSTAPHLHFEVTQDNVHVDPLKYLLK
ncbi:MAG: M23 family metallopeptidase [Candidatus Krumholzibacteria bacterium]|nr:M23 family metallopeptidase [Candidatus Krumholzibacteria bacterium]